MEKVKIPKRIKVGFRVFTIEDWHHEMARRAGLWGECDHNESTIRVDTSAGPVQTMETLLHELMHASWNIAGADYVKEPSEEYLVSMQSAGLTAVLLDNPDLIRFINEVTDAAGVEEIKALTAERDALQAQVDDMPTIDQMAEIWAEIYSPTPWADLSGQARLLIIEDMAQFTAVLEECRRKMTAQK